MSKVHLFNCDNTYKLELVEDLLNRVAELDGRNLSVVKHPFQLAKMSEMVDKISSLAMDMAFFVVHAHESRLSINEDNAGIGYARIYRALLQATGGNVIIVIGGDDNYKEDGEEDRDFISRWAKRKVSSQFSEENIDGRKSFIFSWNKEHRAIHEAALRHHLHSGMKGEKFHYQPPKERQSSKAPTPPQVKYTGSVGRPEEQSFKTSPEAKNAQLKNESELSSSARSPLPKDQRLTEQRPADQSGGRREGSTAHDFETTSGRKSSYINSQRTTPKKNLSPGLERPKDLAVLGISLTDRFMADVKKSFRDIAPKLNLRESPPMRNLPSVPKVKDYLMENHFRFCVLAIDAERIMSDREHQPEESKDYQQLFETVVNRVDARVLVLICSSSSLSKQDEARVEKVVKDFVTETEKVVIGWLRHGIDIEQDVLAQLLTPSSDVTLRGPNQGNSLEWGWQRETNRQVQTQQPRGATANYPATTERAYQGTMVILFHGKIQQPVVDHLLKIHDIKVVKSVLTDLWNKYCTIKEAHVTFFTDTGCLRYIVEIKSTEDPEVEGVKIADNEMLMLSTLVRFGNVCSENQDVQFRLVGFEIPPEIVSDIKSNCKNYPKVHLFVVCDENGQLRCNYITGALNNVFGKMCGLFTNNRKK